MTSDRQFLAWLHERLVRVHGENPNVDYMHKLRAVILATPADEDTPNMGRLPAETIPTIAEGRTYCYRAAPPEPGFTGAWIVVYPDGSDCVCSNEAEAREAVARG